MEEFPTRASPGPKASSEPPQASTLTSTVFERLREDILNGRFEPGEKLRIQALQRRYGVGASPLREALNRLTSLQLVTQVERRGFRVAALSPDGVLDLCRARHLLNEIIVPESLQHGDDAWEQAVVFAHHRMWKYPITLSAKVVNREWELLHRQFHAAVVAACPSKWLRDFHELLFDCADRYRRMLALRVDQRAAEVHHRAIMEAVVRRDSARAIQLLNEDVKTLADCAAPPAKRRAAASVRTRAVSSKSSRQPA